MSKSIMILIIATALLAIGVTYDTDQILIDYDNHYCEWDYDKDCWYLL